MFSRNNSGNPNTWNINDPISLSNDDDKKYSTF